MAQPHANTLSAKMHSVEARWRLRTTEPVVIGPEPKLALSIRARRDVELLHMLLEFPQLGSEEGVAESVLAQVPHVVGLRRLRPEGEPWVSGQENIPRAALIGGADEDLAQVPTHLRWWGGEVQAIEYNRNPSPYTWWCWRGRVLIPRGLAVGVIARSSAPTICRAKMAGV